MSPTSDGCGNARIDVHDQHLPVLGPLDLEDAAGDVVAHPGELADDQLVQLVGGELDRAPLLESGDGPAGRYAPGRRLGVGVYQIGEDQARSCTVAGTISGGSMPSSLAWIVVQRGVGISERPGVVEGVERGVEIRIGPGALELAPSRCRWCRWRWRCRRCVPIAGTLPSTGLGLRSPAQTTS